MLYISPFNKKCILKNMSEKTFHHIFCGNLLPNTTLTYKKIQRATVTRSQMSVTKFSKEISQKMLLTFILYKTMHNSVTRHK